MHGTTGIRQSNKRERKKRRNDKIRIRNRKRTRRRIEKEDIFNPPQKILA
jgi:hypothetical protein